MSQLRCSPQHLQQVGQAMKNACMQSQELFRQLASMSQSLQGEWQGPASQRFQQDFQQLQSQLYRSANSLEQMAASLHQSATRLAEAEQRASGGAGMVYGGSDLSSSGSSPSGDPSLSTPLSADQESAHPGPAIPVGGPPAETATHSLSESPPQPPPESPPEPPAHEPTPSHTPESHTPLHQAASLEPAPTLQERPHDAPPESPATQPLPASAHGPILEIVSSGSLEASAQIFDGSGTPASDTTLVVSGELVEMGGQKDQLSAYFDTGSDAGGQQHPPTMAFGSNPTSLIERIHPFVQGDGDNCGKTSVAMAINAITGSKISDLDLPEGCSLLTELNKHTQDSGLHWNDANLNPDSWQKVETAVSQGLPVVIGLNGEFSHTGRGHVVTIVGIEGDKVTYADPATGTIRETTRQRMLDAEQYPQGSFIMYPSA